jgi:FAD/FMN-containing dehydrogenase
MMELTFTTPAYDELRANVQGEVFTPESAGYDEARLAWNRKVVQYPAVIVAAEMVADVQAAVNFSRRHNLGVAVQSTGHGNVRPADNCLLILTKEMKGLVIDPVAQTATIEAGLQWGPVLAAAQEFDLAPLLGSSSGVGAFGYTLGGGLGWLGRKYGLAADSVIEFELVTADGRLRRASRVENSDLFWGLRGGGGSLGVVTSMTMRLFPVSKVYAGNLYYPAAMAEEVFRRYRSWIANVPDDLTTSVLVMNFPPLPEIPDFLSGKSFAIVRGCYCGAVEEGAAQLAYWRNWQSPLIDDFKEIPFSAADTISSDPVEPMPGFSSGAWLADLSDEAIKVIVDYGLGQGGLSPLIFTEIRHAGGAIGRVERDGTVYGNRDAQLLLNFAGAAPTAKAHDQLVAYSGRMKEALQPSLTGGVYMNLLEGVESQQRIRDGLAPGGYDQLARLKARYDPQNLFGYAFNIRPAG